MGNYFSRKVAAQVMKVPFHHPQSKWCVKIQVLHKKEGVWKYSSQHLWCDNIYNLCDITCSWSRRGFHIIGHNLFASKYTCRANHRIELEQQTATKTNNQRCLIWIYDFYHYHRMFDTEHDILPWVILLFQVKLQTASSTANSLSLSE